ncbi:hypothetical protein [Paenibacillus sediminis]|uniref:Uncharacterized protein n=1 Tax=Paenibacillus sediminis TaxID=664909 RepID=A0ABS4H3U1_9BACL|nr:hypothetical protein [Paenibacillus sediminis]MBP1937178.1 hypothetical protein [Paenibacillus sediminis]
MAMTKPKKGHVEFRPTPVKIVADAPQDEEMREHLDELKANDGYEGSCIVINSKSVDKS